MILGVSVDSTDSHKQFCTKDGLTFHLLARHRAQGGERLRFAGRLRRMTIANRNTFLIDPKGNIAKVWVKVNPTNAASDVLAALP